jgi:hypothetical protein
MAPGIKTCPSCGGLYTGATDRCMGCILSSHAPPPPEVKLSRAERRAAERARRVRKAKEASATIGPAQRTHPPKKKRPKQPTPSPQQTSWANRTSKPSLAPPPPLKRLKPNRPKPVPPKQPVYEQKRGSVPMPTQEPGLGALARAEGRVRAEVGPGGRVVKRATVQCTCLGMNQNCFKCDGTGYCEIELVNSASSSPIISTQKPSSAHNPAPTESHFSNDSRGGDPYGIRERGRFSSNPLHDDYDE